MKATDFSRMRQLFHWVANHTDAFCPSVERLDRFTKTPADDTLSDLRFHVSHFGCHFCGTALSVHLGDGSAAKVGDSLTSLVAVLEQEQSAEGETDIPPVGAGSVHGDVATTIREEFAVAAEAARPTIVRDMLHMMAGSQSDADDICGAVMLEALSRIEKERFRPSTSWEVYLRWLARKRAINLLRGRAKKSFDELQNDSAHSSAVPSPLDVLLSQEKRGRQGTIIHETIRGFCLEHEATSAGRRQREVVERRLRGQSPRTIADAMGLPANTVSGDTSRGFGWIAQRIRHLDRRGSLFGETSDGFH